MSKPARSPESITWVAVSWAGCAMIALNLPISIIDVIANPHAYVAAFAPSVLTLVAVLWAWALARCLVGRSGRDPMRLIVLVSLIALVLHPSLVRDGRTYPPLLHVIGAGICISATVGIRLSALAIVPGASAYVAWVRTPELGSGRAMSEALLLMVSGWLATGVLAIVVRANATVTEAVASAARAAEESLRAERRTFERQRWNGLIHDKVLGALRIVAREPGQAVPAAAVELAGQAVAALEGTVPTPNASLEAAWREHAIMNGLILDVIVIGEVDDPEVHAAVRGATKEALTNVARHSGQNRATIRAVLSKTKVAVLIQDDGMGFDPRLHRAGHGIRTSIEARMKAVGGQARISSRPSAGTRVHLHWEAANSIAPSEWQLRLFAPLMTVGALAVILNIALGAGHWQSIQPLGLAIAAIVAIVGVTAAATFIQPGRGNWIPIIVVSAVTVSALTLSTPAGEDPSWRYWFVGALTPAAGAMSFRFRPWAGLTLAAAITSATCLSGLLKGDTPWACLTGPTPVLFITAIAGHLVRRSFDDAYARVATATANDIESRLATAVAEERAREDDRRISVLRETVLPALEHIAAAWPVTAQMRDKFALLESASRDQLAAPDLVTADLAQRIGLARARGVRIDIVDAPPTPTHEHADHLNECREILAVLSAMVQPGTRIRVNWRGGYGGADTVISATKSNQAARWPAIVAALAGTAGTGVNITSDDDSILIRFSR